MNKRYFISILIIFLIILSLPQIALSQQERLAVVSEFQGEVKVQHDGVWKTVKKIGNRTRNSAVYSDDTVMTMPGSTAVLIFNDNSRLEVKENTTMTVFEKLITGKAVQQKEILRNIKLKTGGLWASITPSKSVLTEFETPTGTASVRGTEISIDYDEATGIAAINLGEGNIVYVSPGQDITFNMEGGEVVRVQVPKSGKGMKLNVIKGDIEVNTPSGNVVNMNVGDGVEVSTTDTGGTSITVTETGEDGGVTVETDAGTVNMSTGDGVEVSTTDTGGTSITVTETGEDGGVTVETDVGTVDMSTGDVIEVGETDTGEMTLSVVEGEVTVETESDTITMDTGDEIVVTVDPDGIATVEVTSGEVEVTDIVTEETQTISEDDTFQTEIDISSQIPDDPDTDGDGYNDNVDAFPSDPAEWLDTDGDGVGDNADIDADGDGIPDDYDKFPLDSNNDNNFFDNFSSGLGKWDTTTNVRTHTSFGPIVAPAPSGVGMSGDNSFAIIQTNGAVDGLLSRQFNVATSGNYQLSFSYNFVTGEYPDHVGGGFNDYFKAELVLSNGSKIQLAYEDVDTSTFTSASGLPLNFNNLSILSDGGQTGWKFFSGTLYMLSGLTTLNFFVANAGDDSVQSAVLIDNVMDPPVAGPVTIVAENENSETNTNVWMNFAKMIRDDIDVDDIDLSAVVADIPGTLNLTDIFGDIWTGKDNIFDSEYKQHASVALLLLKANELVESENGFEVNLDAIRNSLSLAKSFMENHINDFGDLTDMGIRILIDGILTKIDEGLDTSDLLTLNAIKEEIRDAFCNIVDNLTHNNSTERENPFHFCHHHEHDDG